MGSRKTVGYFEQQNLFPIYWVPQRVGRVVIYIDGSVVSLEAFPIYWVPQRVGRSLIPSTLPTAPVGFQFIGFPSEWGGDGPRFIRRGGRVSNLLGSPASGEVKVAD